MTPTTHPVRLYRVSIEVEREAHYRALASVRRGKPIDLPEIAHPDRSRTIDEYDLPDTIGAMCVLAFTRFRSFRPHVVVAMQHGWVARPRIDEIREEVALEDAEVVR